MKRILHLPLAPLSINAVYCKNRSWTTPEYKEWSSGVFHRLSTEDNLQAMADLREFFNPAKHAYIIGLKFYYPSSILYTKKGALSARAHDISNIEKPLIDLIFLPKFYDQPSPYGCKNLNVDDKFIIDMRSQKLASDEHRIEVELSIQSI
jgi:hypothetical protein